VIGRRRFHRLGYTFIEVMIAIVIIGLLTVIATPRLSMARERAYMAAMKSDMRNFAQAQESYFYDNSVYTSSLAPLFTNGLRLSELTTLVIIEATDTGWAAVISHTMSNVRCAMFLGTASPVGAAVDEGVVSCT